MLDIKKYNKIIVANWKLNGSPTFVESYFRKFIFENSQISRNLVIFCPPAPFINQIQQISSRRFEIGAQDCSIYEEGAFTGEISSKILKSIYCKFCIIGHSERRDLFNENDEILQLKASRCLEMNITPILCIGESLEQKNSKKTKEVLNNQIIKSLPKQANKNNIIIAYEPIWAIGTGKIPTLEEINNIHSFIKTEIPQCKDFSLLYGGSVKSSNSKEILSLKAVDGLLVGGSSIDIDEFNKIIKF